MESTVNHQLDRDTGKIRSGTNNLFEKWQKQNLCSSFNQYGGRHKWNSNVTYILHVWWNSVPRFYFQCFNLDPNLQKPDKNLKVNNSLIWTIIEIAPKALIPIKQKLYEATEYIIQRDKIVRARAQGHNPDTNHFIKAVLRRSDYKISSLREVVRSSQDNLVSELMNI